MNEKIAETGIEREPGHMYYVKNGAVWKIRRAKKGVLASPPEMVVDAGVQQDFNYVYWVDGDGDVSRCLRGQTRASGKDTDEDDSVPEAPRMRIRDGYSVVVDGKTSCCRRSETDPVGRSETDPPGREPPYALRAGLGKVAGVFSGLFSGGFSSPALLLIL